MDLHERLVKDTLGRLEAVGRYDHLYLHWEYERGECDILAVRGNVRCYYECKSHYCIQSFMRAYDQFKRVKRFYPQHEWKYVYCSPEHTERVRI